VLATLAGMPPEMGIYASIFPVIVAALLGAAPRLLSGPNTAVAVMLASALAPFATPASTEYVMLALMLTAMVGLVQLLAAAARLGQLFDALPDFVVHGVTLGVGFVIMMTQLPLVMGVLAVPGQPPWMSLWHAAGAFERANPFAIGITSIAVITGMVASRYRWRNMPPLVAALGAGTLAALLLDRLLGAATVDLDRVGHLVLHVLPWSQPSFSLDALYVLKQMIQSALGIAMIGALQTSIIARAVAYSDKAGTHPNRELFAQGMANLAASFTSGFAGSGSFNRSAAHVRAGACTPLAAVLSAVILFILVFAAEPLLAQVPVAAMAGTLLLVGWGLLASTPLRHAGARGWLAALPVIGVGLTVVAAGLETAVFWACAGGIAVLVWNYAQSKGLNSEC